MHAVRAGVFCAARGRGAVEESRGLDDYTAAGRGRRGGRVAEQGAYSEDGVGKEGQCEAG